jgi:hypothetical protein
MVSRLTVSLIINRRVRFTAAGNGTKTLKCENSVYQNPNWTTPGEIYAIYSTECDKAALRFKPYEIFAVA